MKKIIFIDIDNAEGVLEKPKPATEYIPDWYKEAQSYISFDGKKSPNLDGSPSATVKKCMPLWDMMTAGYIIETPYDLYVRPTDDGPIWTWGEMRALDFSPKDQLQNHPWFKEELFGTRLVHPWSIQTPKGWSVLVIQPTHRENLPFEVIPGIIDTDSCSIPTNIFVKLSDPKFEGLIPKGTPFLQVIPMKRENWISELGGEKEKNKALRDLKKIGIVFFDKYKNLWWQRKVYK